MPARRHLYTALLLGFALRLFFLWNFPSADGDTKLYEELAQSWLRSGIYGFHIEPGGLRPVDIRMPGYPGFLAAIYALTGRSPEQARPAVLLAQAGLDLLTCVLIAALAARLGGSRYGKRASTIALWAAALCPFTANYTAVLLSETLALFFTAAALLLFVTAWKADEARVGKLWAAGAVVTGVGTLVRPETPLLLAAPALLLLWRWRRPADRSRLVRTGLLMGIFLMLPLLPWAARNWITLHRVRFLAPRYANLPEEYVPRGFMAWTQTWLVRFRDVYAVSWKLEEDEIDIDNVPDYAFDSPGERARVAGLLDQYNEETELTPELDAGFAQIARERTARHPWRTYLSVPAQRILTIWFTPRVEYLPVSGNPLPLAEKWEDDPEDFLVSAGYGLLNIAYVALALLGAWRARRLSGVGLLCLFVVIRTLFFAQVETPEPRYVLECFPAMLALLPFVFLHGEVES